MEEGRDRFPALRACGVRPDCFLAFPAAVLHPPVTRLSIGAVLELVEIKQERSATWVDCSTWIRLLHGEDWPRADDIPPQTLSTAVTRLRAQVKKTGQAARVGLLEAVFVVPGGSPKCTRLEEGSQSEGPAAKRSRRDGFMEYLSEKVVSLEGQAEKDREELLKVKVAKSGLYDRMRNLKKNW